ncbi:hypothetical protein HYT23_02415 [Candidatus Pacearchaeota archaeon]|nr:hypothetical protein [Candidatus Pacearchaeota archaeon]
MLLEEIIKDIKEISADKENDVYINPPIEIEGVSRQNILKIVRTSAKVQAVEEDISCLSNRGAVPGSRHADLILQAEKFGFSGQRMDAIRNFKDYLPFFITSLGPHVSNVTDAFFASEYLKQRKSLRPLDVFFSYYRTSTGITLGLGEFSPLAKGVDVVSEMFKTALGSKDACSKVMPEHLSFPRIGLMTETSVIGAYCGEAAGMAMALSPWLYSKDMPYEKGTVVHTLLGDSGVNEPSFRMAYGMVENFLYLMARESLDLKTDDIDEARKNVKKQKEIYSRLNQENKVRLAAHIFDNGVGISCKSDIVHPFADPLSSLRRLEDLGLINIYEYSGLDFFEVLKYGRIISEESRKGLVAAHVKVPRPGGHSMSNFYGLGKIQGRKNSPIGSLSLEEVMFDNNNDPLFNAVSALIKNKYLTSQDAREMLLAEQKSVLEVLADEIAGYKHKTVVDLNPVTASHLKDNKDRWNFFIKNSPLEMREKLWKGGDNEQGHLEIISGVPGLGIGLKKTDDVYLPEHLESITPLQAENMSLADIMMLSNGNLYCIGEDIPDASPFDFERVYQHPRSGTGGIDHATARLQVLADKINPGGKRRITDIGINEAGIYDLGAGIKHAIEDKGVVLAEIQFNDYNFPLFALEQISSLYQRSNGNENIPIIIRHSAGFMRTGNIEEFFERGGAAGMYHSACTAASLAGAYPGLSVVMPNTSRAVQMAYRNAVASQTPTLILMTSPVMHKLPLGSFNYSDKYAPLDELDPVHTAYVHRVKDEKGVGFPVGAHDHIILTYGEYVPLSYMVAENLFMNKGVKTLVVDYNSIVPRDKSLIRKIMREYHSFSKKPKFSIVSQEADFGFSGVILQDLVSVVVDGVRENDLTLLTKAARKSGWLEEHLINPTPKEIYFSILSQHSDKNTMSEDILLYTLGRQRQTERMRDFTSSFQDKYILR